LNPSGVLKSANSIATEFAAAAAAATSGTGNGTSVYCGATNRRAHSLLRYMNQVCVQHYAQQRGIISKLIKYAVLHYLYVEACVKCGTADAYNWL
jgi:hypothetical protein